MSNSKKGNKVYELLVQYLSEHDFKFEQHKEDLTITLMVQGEDLPQLTLIRVLDDLHLLQVISPIPSKIPEDKRIDAAIAVSVANYGMINGSFDYDINDGEIRYRITQSYLGAEPSSDTLDYVLNIAFHTTDKYNDKFFMLGKGMLSLEQFISNDRN